MDYIIELFKKGKEQYKDHLIMAPCFNSAWSKLSKYYKKTSDTLIYAAVLVLYLAYKWEYIKANWTQVGCQTLRNKSRSSENVLYATRISKSGQGTS
jgi:hypothetical protein